MTLEKIIDIQLLARGFYQLQLEQATSVQNLLNLKSINRLGKSPTFFVFNGKHNFNVQEAIKEQGKVLTITAYFPKLTS
jgi:hypothetical protein